MESSLYFFKAWTLGIPGNNRMSSCHHLSFTYIHVLDVIIFLIVHAEINELCIW